MKLPINQIIQGDVRKVLVEFPSNSIDLLLTDPPYNISHKGKITRSGGKFGNAKDIKFDMGEWDHGKVYPKEWIPYAVKILKENGIFISFCDKREVSYLCDILELEGMKVRQIGGWHKRNPVPQARKVKWQSALELFVIATKNKKTGHHYNYKEGQRHNVIEAPICQGKERLEHPTQKPEALAEQIIRWWSFENDLILDPFCGTGTFSVVAQKLGRRWIGIDISKKYCEMARKRISNECSYRLEKFI